MTAPDNTYSITPVTNPTGLFGWVVELGGSVIGCSGFEYPTAGLALQYGRRFQQQYDAARVIRHTNRERAAR